MIKKTSDLPLKPKTTSPDQVKQDLEDVTSDDPVMKLLNDELTDLNEDCNRLEQIEEVINKHAELNNRFNDLTKSLNDLKSQETALGNLSTHLSAVLKAIPPDAPC